MLLAISVFLSYVFFNETATPEIYTYWTHSFPTRRSSDLNQENHRNRCAGHEREVAPRMRRLGVVAVLELVHHYGGSFATTPSGVTLCRSEEHTSELQSLMRISYAVFCLHKKPPALDYAPAQHHIYSPSPTPTHASS